VQGVINPYTCYAVSFALPVLLYTLRWSDLYPSFSPALIVFIVCSIAIHIFFGVRLARSKKICFRPVDKNLVSPVAVTVFIYALWTSEFIHAGGIPLMRISLGLPYDYKTFGIPSLHVFIVTFSSFYTVYLFHIYLSQKNKIHLLLYGINLASAILIYNRGMFLFNLFATLILVLLYIKKNPFKYILSGIAALILISFLFGVLGTLRVSRESQRDYSNKLFLATGGANDRFRNSIVPDEFFWTYIYVTSPIANLQQNINGYPVEPITPVRAIELFNNEFLMDFISKRVNTLMGWERESEITIPGPFNVSTVYSRSYSYAGWPGIFLMAAFVLAVPMVFVRVIRIESNFFLSGFAILCSLYLFLAFDNTLRFTGLSFQLVYPVLLHYASEKLPRVKNFSVNNKVT
jgi:hypothetical protein